MASKVLLVEDDPSSAEILQMILESGGYETEVAGTAKQALAALEYARCDVAVLDMMLPGMTTEDFVTALAALKNPPPLIVHSARPQNELDIIARKLKAVGVLNKPTSIEMILETVARACPSKV